MARRSDHSREELRRLMVEEGSRQLAGTGLARFSAREVAKGVGYSVGTLYNVFGSYDELMLAINARTLQAWAAELRARLAAAANDRLAALVAGYFAFAEANPELWVAIYEYHMADGGPAPEWYQSEVAQLMAVVGGEIAEALDEADPRRIESLTRSLVATVHGHCVFSIYRTFSLLGETAPQAAALARVREAIDAASRIEGDDA